MRSTALLAALALLLAACAPSLNDDDDATSDDDDATSDDDDATSDDDDDATSTDDDDTVGDDDDMVDDDDDDDAFPCEDETTVLEPAEVSALGFSADDVIAAVAGPSSAEASWTETGTAVGVSLAIAATGDPTWHDLSPGEPDPGGPDIQCLDYLEVPVSLSLSTDDGAFDEVLATAMVVRDLASPSASADLDLEGLGGTFDWSQVPGFDPDEWDSVGLSLSNMWTDDGINGQVSVSASRTLPDGIGEGLVGPILLW